MIVPMSKVFIVTQSHNHTRLLDILAQLGVVHIEPVDPNKAVAEEKTLHTLSSLDHALQILQKIEPAGDTPDLSPLEACAETIEINKTIVEQKERLGALHRTASQLTIWGNVEVKRLKHLSAMGIQIRFFSVAKNDLPGLEAECIEIISEISSKEVMIAVIDRIGTFQIPEEAKEISWPSTDLPTLKKEAAELDVSLKKHDNRLTQLANLIDKIKNERKQYQSKADFHIAQNSGLTSKALFAIQGWIPSAKADLLSEYLNKNDISAAVDFLPPEEGELPPTLIEYPKWAKPIKGLFDILGTVAGYREFDVSAPFMLALPIFSAMLIGDGGYGAILLIGLLLGYKKAVKTLGEDFTRLMIVIGGTTLLWGFLCGSFFGKVLYKPPIPVDMSDASRYLLMKISFIMGAIHLSFAQVWQAIRVYPNLRYLSKVGWGIFIWGMFGVVNMFVLGANLTWGTPWPYLLIIGGILAITFDSPNKNIVKMVLVGTANFPLSMLSAFSDVISYVRLMAVGLASGVLATSFNDLASGMHPALSVIVLVFGHSLNLGLALIALFAHGVRLNMLEFSNNLGMQWIGYSYKPFKTIQE